jgi:hypothetical protein
LTGGGGGRATTASGPVGPEIRNGHAFAKNRV